MAEHGYVTYSRGCRCDVCREAKAAYIRNQRASRATSAKVHGIRHGYSGYANHKCRCIVCRRAKGAQDKRRSVTR